MGKITLPTAKGVAAVSKGTIGAFIWVYKKMYSLSGISPGGFSGNTFYYGSKFLTVIYVSLLVATYLFGDLNKQGWRIVMNVASVIAAVKTTIYAVMTYAAYGGYSIAAARVTPRRSPESTRFCASRRSGHSTRHCSSSW